jgi:hypothetical protein
VSLRFKYPVRFGWTTASVAGAAEALKLGSGEVDVCVLLKPFDEGRMVLTVEDPLEGSKSAKASMADMIQEMMGVPADEALKLVPESKSGGFIEG